MHICKSKCKYVLYYLPLRTYYVWLPLLNLIAESAEAGKSW